MSDFYCEEVLNGKTPVDVVRETEYTLAFRHTRPAYPVHIVVIPKKHIESLLTVCEADRPWIEDLLRVPQDVAGEVKREQGAAKIITNLGSYQDSKHLHVHVVCLAKK